MATFHNLFTGTSQGEFDLLRVRDASGQMVDVLTLRGGDGGAVTSATAPLSISAGVLSVDLSSKQDALTAGTGVTISGTTISADLSAYATQAYVFARDAGSGQWAAEAKPPVVDGGAQRRSYLGVTAGGRGCTRPTGGAGRRLCRRALAAAHERPAVRSAGAGQRLRV